MGELFPFSLVLQSIELERPYTPLDNELVEEESCKLSLLARYFIRSGILLQDFQD